jgi:hypothetical protein
MLCCCYLEGWEEVSYCDNLQYYSRSAGRSYSHRTDLLLLIS